MSNYKKLSFVVVLVFCLSLLSLGSGIGWASEVQILELTKGKASYNLSKYQFGNSSYLKVDDISRLLDIPYELNPNGSVLLGEGGRFIMGSIGLESPVTIRKEQLQTMYSDNDPIFIKDNESLFVEAGIILSVFTDNIMEAGKNSYPLDKEKSLKFYLNGSERTFDDYIIIGDIIYVDMNSYLEEFSTKNARHTEITGWLKVTDKNFNNQYMIKKNSNRDIDFKSEYVENTIPTYCNTYSYTEVSGRDYLDLSVASIGNFLDKEGDIINIYDIDYIKSQLAVSHRIKNIQEIISYITGLENFETSNKIQVYLKEGDKEFEKAGNLSLGYGSTLDGINLTLKSSDDNNEDSPFYNNKIDIKLYVDKYEKSLYRISESGEKFLDSAEIDSSLIGVLHAVQFENGFYFDLLNKVFNSIPDGKRIDSRVYIDETMSMLAGIGNDSMFTQDDEDYSYSLNTSNVLYALKKEKSDGNSLAAPLYDSLLKTSEKAKFDFNIDFDFDEDTNKLTNIAGEFVYEINDIDKKAIKVVFKSYIKHNK